jgi:outer membrane protein assembly factor BamA
MPQLIQLVAIACSLLVAGPPQSGPLQVAAITVDGERRYKPAEVVQSSGLTPGRQVTPAELAAALQRMAATGLYKSVNYRYVTAAGRTTIILEIEEADWTMPVEFDNFVWFKDEELAQALRGSVFSFDGKVPINAGIPELIMSELQKLLKAKNLPGEVEFYPQGTIKGQILAYVFRVKDAGLKLCALKFPGAAVIKESDLAERLGTVGSDYSRSYLTNASKGTLTDMYHQRGRWRATLSVPVASVTNDAGCQGVTAAITVDEGLEYAWNAPVWAGNAVLATRELDDLLAIKVGNAAGVAQVNEGLLRIKNVYQKQGYLQYSAALTPKLDDASRRATPVIAVTEGPQFRFGTLELVGLSAADSETLRKGWKLKTNDIFDASYPSDYVSKELRPRLKSGTPFPAMQTQVDEQNRLVNVRIVFGGQGAK